MCKRLNKLFISFVIICSVISLGMTTVSAESWEGYEDVSKDDAHYEGIKELSKQGVLTGYESNKFKPWENISRAHMAVVLSRVNDYEEPEDISKILESYKDINANSMYAKEIAALTEAEVFGGDENDNFDPDADITREQMASVLVSAMNLDQYDADEVDINLENVDKSHKSSVQVLANLELTTELDDFRPAKPITRAAVATLVDRTQTYVEEQDDQEDDNDITDMKKSVENFHKENEINNDEAANELKDLLTSIENFKNDGEDEKALEHLKELRQSINNQKGEDSISEEAYQSLHRDVRDLIGKNEDTAIVGYWEGDGKLDLDDIPADNLTHINYAFAPVNEEGKPEVSSGDQKEIEKLNKYKEDHPHVESLISIGGWGQNSYYISDLAATEESREQFVEDYINTYIDEYEFDGIDLDWEFPVRGGEDGMQNRLEDKENQTKLFKEFREQLNEKEIETGEEYLLTTATPTGRYQNGGPYVPGDSYEFDEIPKYLDWVQLMTYDMANGFAPTTNHNAPMHPVDADPMSEASKKWNNVSGAVEYYEKEGVPKDKMVLGTAFYGRSFIVSNSKDDGLYQPYDEPGANADWKEIKDDYLDDSNWIKHWDSTAEVPWMFNPETKRFLTYDNPESIGKKAAFINDNELRGGMIWSIGLDDEEHTLLNALSEPILKNNNQ